MTLCLTFNCCLIGLKSDVSNLPNKLICESQIVPIINYKRFTPLLSYHCIHSLKLLSLIFLSIVLLVIIFTPNHNLHYFYLLPAKLAFSSSMMVVIPPFIRGLLSGYLLIFCFNDISHTKMSAHYLAHLNLHKHMPCCTRQDGPQIPRSTSGWFSAHCWV